MQHIRVFGPSSSHLGLTQHQALDPFTAEALDAFKQATAEDGVAKVLADGNGDLPLLQV